MVLIDDYWLQEDDVKDLIRSCYLYMAVNHLVSFTKSDEFKIYFNPREFRTVIHYRNGVDLFYSALKVITGYSFDLAFLFGPSACIKIHGVSSPELELKLHLTLSHLFELFANIAAIHQFLFTTTSLRGADVAEFYANIGHHMREEFTQLKVSLLERRPRSSLYYDILSAYYNCLTYWTIREPDILTSSAKNAPWYSALLESYKDWPDPYFAGRFIEALDIGVKVRSKRRNEFANMTPKFYTPALKQEGTGVPFTELHCYFSGTINPNLAGLLEVLPFVRLMETGQLDPSFFDS